MYTENQQFTNSSYTSYPSGAYGANTGVPYSQPYAAPSSRPASRRKKKNGGAKIVAVALCCSLLGSAAGAGIMRLTMPASGTAAAGASTTIYESDRKVGTLSVERLTTKEKLTAAEVYAQNVNSTVGIRTTMITTNYFGFKTSSPASGSGFILSSDGYIVTNYHVVEGANGITVTAYDGTTYDAALVGYDESNDVAVLKVDAEGLTPVVLGDSDTLNVGEEVIAIGNPLGELTFSLTSGVVSALDREITMSDGTTMTLIQTDAAINSGNSGGALFNLYGEVVGITNAKYSGSSSSEATIDNIGFAIPMASVQTIITDIIEKGYISKPYIGVSLAESADGLTVRAVSEGSPAETAGLQAGDVIRTVGDTDAADADTLTAAISTAAAGDTLTLEVLRGSETLQITVTVGEKQQSALPETDATQESEEQPGSSSVYGSSPFEFFGGMYGRS